MPLIPEELIDEVQARTDIAEVIGRYIPLRRAGRHFKALCPFHHEKTPSFMVNTEKQIFHCFGCGTGGNIFSFLMQHDRMTFPEAVRQLADHAGVRLPEREAGSRNGTHERLVALTEKICHFFERTLDHPLQGKAARVYLEGRGVTEPTRRAFRLGYAPAGWDHLLGAARTTGVSTDDLEAVGLIVKGRANYYDRFRNRLIFPIVDVRGRVVGFGGRSLDSEEPKYLNSPETLLYTKGRHLFGLSQAKDAIVQQKTAVVVEGYFDCVVLADAGISPVVSPLGTALTVDQARLLKRYAESVILAFDADAAGEAATLRGIDLLVEAGLHVHIAQLPDGVDPDECLRSSGRASFEARLGRSVSLFDFLVECALRRYPATGTEQKVKAAQFVLPTLAKVPNAMLRSEYVRLLSDRLRLDEAAVAAELAKAQPRASVAASTRGAGPTTVRRPIAQGPERLLTALVLDDPSRWEQLQSQLSLDDIVDPTLRRILGLVAELMAAGEAATPAQVVSRLSAVPSEGGQAGLSEDGQAPPPNLSSEKVGNDLVGGQGALVTELVQFAQSVASKDEAFADCMRRLRANAHKRQLGLLREQLQAAQTAGQDRDVHRLLVEYQRQVKGD